MDTYITKSILEILTLIVLDFICCFKLIKEFYKL